MDSKDTHNSNTYVVGKPEVLRELFPQHRTTDARKVGDEVMIEVNLAKDLFAVVVKDERVRLFSHSAALELLSSSGENKVKKNKSNAGRL
jgi:hypothetical protein